jgi:hypothetical protein
MTEPRDASVKTLARLADSVGDAGQAGRVNYEQLAQTLDALGIGLCIYDADDFIIEVNETYRTFFSAIGDRLKPGALYRELLVPYYASAPASILRGRTLEQFLFDADARRMGAQVTQKLRPFAKGMLLHFDYVLGDKRVISLRFDVTEQWSIDRTFNERRIWAENLTNLSYDYLWRTDATTLIVQFDAPLGRTPKCDLSNLVGSRFAEALTGLPGTAANLSQMQSQHPMPLFEAETIDATGQKVLLEIAGTPIQDSLGAYGGYFGGARLSRRTVTT